MFDPRINALMLSIAVIATGALVWGGVTTWRRGERQKGVLMIVAAVVLLGNVLVWTV
ncbi:hypothetical protein [Sphingomonas sp. dw_22]|uniref:hypothetical protein n=1 Tax=Sphingomonas sp. dw_22 TaxID=2721175 RepID=UPI001BD60110|nr:hypothetical protein [Sphingomonas sp. dw_22]